MRVEYYENTGSANCEVWWERAEGVLVPDVATGEWRGEYYGSVERVGAPALVRSDKTLVFDWGANSPATGLPSDYFSVRWSRRIRFKDGMYTFKVQADDGVRLWVAGDLLVDRWHGGYTDDTITKLMRAGDRDVVVEYFELEGLAKVSVTWEGPKTTATPPPEPVITNWRGAYYRGSSLLDQPVLVRDDEQISFSWGQSVPVSTLSKNEGYSVRWTRRISLDEGPYRFRVEVDGGVKVWIDGKTLIDAWTRVPNATHVGHLYFEGSGQHDIRVEYRNGSNAGIRFTWEKIETFSGWKGEYFGNRDLTGKPVFVRDDAQINFDWRGGSPGPVMPSNNFSVRWTRTLDMEKGLYRFTATADDGIRVHVDGETIIDAWRMSPGARTQKQIRLDEGEHTIVGEYFEKSGDAKLSFGWELLEST